MGVKLEPRRSMRIHRPPRKERRAAEGMVCSGTVQWVRWEPQGCWPVRRRVIWEEKRDSAANPLGSCAVLVLSVLPKPS